MTRVAAGPDLGRLRSSIWRWTRNCDRPLPWRGETDPYRVLVSEVMLQQTQASRVAPAYEAFLTRFPDLDALAAAEPADVLRAWSGLGHNRRAVALWLAVREVRARGAFPVAITELCTLPGVGPYTARALASFAFGADEAVVEANVRRVLTRFYALEATDDVQALADRWLPRGHSAAWNQAMMDLGALVCIPRTPRCHLCPLADRCAWPAGRRREPVPRAPKPRFEDSTRFARGRIVAALREASCGATTAGLSRSTGLGSRRTTEALAALAREGLVSRRARTWTLGGVEGQPRPSRRRDGSRTT